ncbi:hypothetical protein [uncultured Bacteroides sp.]|uniref:hypothetical protein n=1 Tax=uncultured Bacteroides sp. TaxID=162156 RepID=UPI002AAAFC91|nr:hypothetical protein [uncultured Bacteroides sp.]
MKKHKHCIFWLTAFSFCMIGCNGGSSTTSSPSSTANEELPTDIAATTTTGSSDTDNSQVDEDIAEDNVPENSTTHVCVNCNGSGSVIWSDGSMQTCPTCGGTGIINVQQVINEVNSQMNGNIGMNPRSGSSSRNREQIMRDIDKMTRMLNDNKATLQNLQDRNESVTLWASYQNMISQCEERIDNLNSELNSASE